MSYSDNSFSPCDLIQEHVILLSEPDWRVFVACMLMNMTRGTTMRPYMWSLFDKWPTAHALSCANFDELREHIKPLGFSARRAANLIRMSTQYITDTWSTPHDLCGCGKYAYDSWRIFCRGDIPLLDELKDKELRRYINWLTTGIHVPQPELV